MKKFFTMILALVLLIFSAAFVSCGESEKTNGNGDENEEVVLGSFDDLSEFTIVRGDKGTAGEKEAAVELRKILSEKFGAELSLSTDFGTAKSKEILIGHTSRSESKETESAVSTESKYVIKRSGNKIVIMGGSDEALMNAITFWTGSMVNGEGKLCIPKNKSGYVYSAGNKLESLTVLGTPMSEYKIYCEASGLSDMASRIQSSIFEAADVKLEIAKKISAGNNFIILTNAAESPTVSSFKLDEKNIVITSSYYDFEWAVDYFIDILNSAEGDLDITEEMNAESVYEAEPLYDKDDLLKVLGDVYNSDNVVIGTELGNSPSMVSSMLTRYFDASGEYPGILGLDIRYSNLNKLGEDGIERVVAELTSYAQNGGIITMSTHMSNPKNGDPSIEDYRGTLGGDDVWAELVTEGTELNASLKTELSGMADFLTKLRDNGVPVIWRPLHEANGNWFWFCMVQKLSGGNVAISEESFANLWIYMHDYFTNERGLDNLLWNFGPNIGKESKNMVSPLYGFPGKEYVDICGFDWYTGNGDPSAVFDNPTYDDLSELDMIININEFGPSGDMIANTEGGEKQEDIFSCENILGILKEMIRAEYNIGYFLTWTDPINIPALGKSDVLMKSEIAIGQAELKAMFEALK